MKKAKRSLMMLVATLVILAIISVVPFLTQIKVNKSKSMHQHRISYLKCKE